MSTYSANATTLAYALGKSSTWNSGYASQGATANGQPRDGLILFSNLRSAVSWADMTVSEVRLWLKFGTAGASRRKYIGFYAASRSSVGGVGNEARGAYIGDVYTSSTTYGANETITFNETTNAGAFAGLKAWIEDGSTTGLCIFKGEWGDSSYTDNFLNISQASIQIDYDLKGSKLSVTPTAITPGTEISFDVTPIATTGTLTHVLRSVIGGASSDITTLGEGVTEYDLTAPDSWFTSMKGEGVSSRSVTFALDTYVDGNLQGTKEVAAALSVPSAARPSINIFTPRRYGSYIDDQSQTQYRDDPTGVNVWADIAVSVDASAAPGCQTASLAVYWWPVSDETQRALLATISASTTITSYTLTHSAGMFGSTQVPVSDSYVLELVADNGYFSVSTEVTVSKSWAPLHIAGSGYGVGVGMFSPGTEQSPSFDVAWPINAYGGANITGVTTYTSGEQATGGYWIDGKPIYRYVMTGTVSGTGDKTLGNLPSTPEHVLRMYGEFIHDANSHRPIAFTSYGGIAWSLSPIVWSQEVHLYIGSNYNNPNTHSYVLVLEYTKA